MEHTRQLRDAAERLRQEDDARKTRHQEVSRKRLERIINKRLSTTLIGNLSTLEKHLGHLWGHGKEEDELSEQEIAWLDMWVRIRDEMLDKGNAQIRAVDRDLRQYTVHWNGVEIVLAVPDRQA